MLIFTHDGIFHQDEIFGIVELIFDYFKYSYFVNNQIMIINEKELLEDNSLYNKYKNIENKIWICRTRNKELLAKAKMDKDVYVLDVGFEYSLEINNYDHHQDIKLPASNMLVYKMLLEKNKDTRVVLPVLKELKPFMIGISNIDTNHENANLIWKEFNKENKYRGLHNIISAFNRNPKDKNIQDIQFKKALDIAIEVYKNELYNAGQRAVARVIYEKRQEINKNTVLFNDFCPIWKEYEEYKYAIQPNPQGWSVNSIDSSKYPLKWIDEKDWNKHGIIFMHKGLFIAVFKEQKDAIKYIKKCLNE